MKRGGSHFTSSFAWALIFSMIGLAAFLPMPIASGQTVADYTCLPPFVVSSSVQPNVLIVLDNSGSMNDQAYAGSFDPDQFESDHYYGYFDPEALYRYNGSRWEVTTQAITTGTAANPIASGDFLNWATMRRVDVSKKLLIGGKANPRSANPGQTVKLLGENAPTSWNFTKTFDNTAAPGLIYPFVGNYSYKMVGDDLSVTPVAGSSTIDAAPTANFDIPAAWTVTPSGTQAYQAVLTNDGNTSYIRNTTTTPALFDYKVTGPDPGTIASVEVFAVAKKSSSTTMRLQGVLQINNQNYAGNFSNLTTSYTTYSWKWDVNPNTGLPWVWTDFKNAGGEPLNGFGVQAYTQPTGTRYPSVTQVFLRINLSIPSGGPFAIIVDMLEGQKATGIMDTLSDDVRFGLAFYNNGCGLECGTGGGKNDGGHIENYVDFGATTSMITTIGNMTPTTWTPLGETYYEMVRYFRQEAPNYANSPADYQTGASTQYDPYYYMYSKLTGSGLADQYVPCAKSFVLLLTDGESTMDKNIPASIQGLSSGYRFAGTVPGTTYNSSGTDFLIDVAHYARTQDLRSDLTGDQTIVLYSVFMFGKGSTLLKDAAINGGFNDENDDNKPGPDLSEYLRDSNEDGNITSSDLPLTYYEGDDGFELEISIVAAINDILKRSASGTAVSVLATSSTGEGAVYQAYFYTQITNTITKKTVSWPGFLQGLFVDARGNLREDSDNNGELDLVNDLIVRIAMDTASNEVRIHKWQDTNGDGVADVEDPSTAPDGIPLNESDPTKKLNPLWEAGELLARTPGTDRKIYTWTEQGGWMQFNTAAAGALQDYLRAADVTESTNIIQYIRGERGELETGDPALYRYRGTTNLTNCADKELDDSCIWKLGDIVYSTPTVVGAPRERYDLIWGDPTYSDFYEKYLTRRQVVYVGANDGMLHAFNAGFFQPGDRATGQHAKFTANPDGTGSCAPTDSAPAPDTCGRELWSIVPYQLLPHLKWLTETAYTHVYYVDLKPKVTDVRIFPEDGDHPNGWGTILIGGMRFGGGPITVTVSGSPVTLQSAYFVLDITNPESPDYPKLLWTFTASDLGFTLSYPSVSRVDEDEIKENRNETWFMQVGSGPSVATTTDTYSTNSLKLFVLAMPTSFPTYFTSATRAITLDSAGFSADSIANDAELDYTVEAIYLGSVLGSGMPWGGKVYEVLTLELQNASSWDEHVLLDVGRPIAAPLNAAMDSLGNVWIFGGTGRFYSQQDRTDFSQEIMFGVKTVCWKSPGSCSFNFSLTDLMDVTAVTVNATTGIVSGASCPGCDQYQNLINYINPQTPDAGTPKGWWRKPPQLGERVIGRPGVLAGYLFFTTYLPGKELCKIEGESFIYGLYYETGSAYTKPISGLEDTSTSEIDTRMELGLGLPADISVHLGEQSEDTGSGNGCESGAKGFVQASTGEVLEVCVDTVFGLTSGVVTWREEESVY
jgi:type IV pilus assembly protein PilY1